VINSHKTTQVAHQIINTIILNWVGQSNDTLCWPKQQRGVSFQLEAMA